MKYSYWWKVVCGTIAVNVVAVAAMADITGCDNGEKHRRNYPKRSDVIHGDSTLEAKDGWRIGGAVESAVNAFNDVSIAGFDTNALTTVEYGNSTAPFMLKENRRYYEYCKELLLSSAADSLERYIATDSDYRKGKFSHAVVVLAMGMQVEGRPPYIAICAYGDDGGKLYWSELDGLGRVSVFVLPNDAPQLVDSILRRRPWSVEEHGADDNRMAFVSISSTRDRYVMIVAPWASTLGVSYGKNWEYSSKITRQSFLNRRAVDSLLSIIAYTGDPKRWGGVW